MGATNAQTLREKSLSLSRSCTIRASLDGLGVQAAFLRLTLYLRAVQRTGPRFAGYHVYILYSILLAVGFVLALPWFFWKGRKSSKYMRTFRERMGRLPVYLNVDGERSIWIHAVSVGEALAARPLVPALRERFPGYRLFLSTITLTGI